MDVLTIFMPLIAALTVCLFRSQISDRGAQFLTCGSILISVMGALVLVKEVIFGSNPYVVKLLPWISCDLINLKYFNFDLEKSENFDFIFTFYLEDGFDYQLRLHFLI